MTFLPSSNRLPVEQPKTADGLMGRIDRHFLKVAQDSFPNTLTPASRFGWLSGYMYDESIPALNYIGGADKWTKFISNTDTYKFRDNNREISKNNAHDVIESILQDSISSAPFLFTGIASGTEFSHQEIHYARALYQQTEGLLKGLHVFDGNYDFASQSRDIVETELPGAYFSASVHDIYKSPITLGLKNCFNKESAQPRRTLAVYSGGTIGNIGLTSKELEQGFPIKNIADHLRQQIDHDADESYLIVSHNAQNDPSVLENYSGEAHANFALSALHRIKRELQTRNFDPHNFRYEASYDPKLELVRHSAISTRDQVFSIGNKEVHLSKDQEACRVGHSFQITSARMGEILHAADLIRIATVASDDGNTLHTVAKATRKLLQSQKRKYANLSA